MRNTALFFKMMSFGLVAEVFGAWVHGNLLLAVFNKNLLVIIIIFF